jgi:hypothetical protein
LTRVFLIQTNPENATLGQVIQWKKGVKPEKYFSIVLCTSTSTSNSGISSGHVNWHSLRACAGFDSDLFLISSFQWQIAMPTPQFLVIQVLLN